MTQVFDYGKRISHLTPDELKFCSPIWLDLPQKVICCIVLAQIRMAGTV